MALIKCKECGKEISDKAEYCVHCGCPIEMSKEVTTEKEEKNKEKDNKKEEKEEIKDEI